MSIVASDAHQDAVRCRFEARMMLKIGLCVLAIFAGLLQETGHARGRIGTQQRGPWARATGASEQVLTGIRPSGTGSGEVRSVSIRAPAETPPVRAVQRALEENSRRRRLLRRCTEAIAPSSPARRRRFGCTLDFMVGARPRKHAWGSSGIGAQRGTPPPSMARPAN